MMIRKFVNHALKIDVKRFPRLDLRRRRKLLNHFQINKILDVGANIGQYAEETFKTGFYGHIVSFEPTAAAYNKLKKKSTKNNNWSALNFGLGNDNYSTEINISKNSYSSSILKINKQHLDAAPDATTVRKETINIKTLDSIYNNYVFSKDIPLLKIDAQGFEKNVLAGAQKSLKKIKGLQIEMSIEELYQEEMLFDEMIKFLKSYDFNLYSLENGFYNPTTGKLLQVDGIFFK